MGSLVAQMCFPSLTHAAGLATALLHRVLMQRHTHVPTWQHGHRTRQDERVSCLGLVKKLGHLPSNLSPNDPLNVNNNQHAISRSAGHRDKLLCLLGLISLYVLLELEITFIQPINGSLVCYMDGSTFFSMINQVLVIQPFQESSC